MNSQNLNVRHRTMKRPKNKLWISILAKDYLDRPAQSSELVFNNPQWVNFLFVSSWLWLVTPSQPGTSHCWGASSQNENEYNDRFLGKLKYSGNTKLKIVKSSPVQSSFYYPGTFIRFSPSIPSATYYIFYLLYTIYMWDLISGAWSWSIC